MNKLFWFVFLLSVLAFQAKAITLDCSQDEGALSLSDILREDNPKVAGCAFKDGRFYVDEPHYLHGKVAGVRVYPIDQQGRVIDNDEAPKLMKVDYSALCRFDESCVPSLFKRGRKLFIEYYDCKDGTSREIASVRRIE